MYSTPFTTNNFGGTQYPPPGLGSYYPPPGFLYRYVHLPFPSNGSQPPVYSSPPTRPTAPAPASHTSSSTVSPSPIYSSPSFNSTLMSMSHRRPTAISRPASSAMPENWSSSSLPSFNSPTAYPSTSQQTQPPPNTYPYAAAQPVVNQQCPVIMQPIYIWYCCCAANHPPPTPDSSGSDRYYREPHRPRYTEVTSEAPRYTTTCTHDNTRTPEVSILSPVNMPYRPCTHQTESANARQIPRRQHRRGHRDRQLAERQERRVSTESTRPELPKSAFFKPIKRQEVAWRGTPSTSASAEPTPLIRPVPIRARREIYSPSLPRRRGPLPPQSTQNADRHTAGEQPHYHSRGPYYMPPVSEEQN